MGGSPHPQSSIQVSEWGWKVPGQAGFHSKTLSSKNNPPHDKANTLPSVPVVYLYNTRVTRQKAVTKAKAATESPSTSVRSFKCDCRWDSPRMASRQGTYFSALKLPVQRSVLTNGSSAHAWQTAKGLSSSADGHHPHPRQPQQGESLTGGGSQPWQPFHQRPRNISKITLEHSPPRTTAESRPQGHSLSVMTSESRNATVHSSHH